jgi:cytochrome c peroxidase
MKFWLTLFFPLLILLACSNEETKVANETKLKEPSTIAELGELLFFDSLLSDNNRVSCASCHKPQFAFADNLPFSFGVDSIKTERNTPSIMNQASRSFFFYDGRAETLEQQVLGPMENPKEMNLPMSFAIEKLILHKQYKTFFNKLFGQNPTKDNITKAIAAYEKTLETSDSDFDNYVNKVDTTKLTTSAKRGQQIFINKGKCFDCHFGPDFTGDEFKNIGLFNGKDLNDSGRYLISKNKNDVGSFKVPGLRNVAVTAPYMHNGMFTSLKQVIDYYDSPNKTVNNAINRDTLLNKPLLLTDQEKMDLENFLLSLTDKRFKK